jgi:hypothetical protein
MPTESLCDDGPLTTIIESFGGDVMHLAGSITSSDSIPSFIPADQAYFWSLTWQESERRALDDISAGRVQSFADPAEAVRHLLGRGDPQ